MVYDIFRNAVKLDFKPTIAPLFCSFRDAQLRGVSLASIWAQFRTMRLDKKSAH
uniref:Uncharacterized protein n=1 Tax=Cupriavidus taiwanensis TaxID=164546 RepID=A0A375HB70_9BURK|nr:protein of unknown function [Cupriavidus taiwanensis]